LPSDIQFRRDSPPFVAVVAAVAVDDDDDDADDVVAANDDDADDDEEVLSPPPRTRWRCSDTASPTLTSTRRVDWRRLLSFVCCGADVVVVVVAVLPALFTANAAIVFDVCVCACCLFASEEGKLLVVIDCLFVFVVQLWDC
jgi:hypothetical protein